MTFMISEVPLNPIAPVDRNYTSVVLWIEVGDRKILLGADLEHVRGRADEGWEAILNSKAPVEGKADFFKIPHHGGESSHHPRVWDVLVKDKENHYAATTSYSRSRPKLPADTDVARIGNLSNNAYVAGVAKVRRKKYSREIDNMLHKKGQIALSATYEFGRVTLKAQIHSEAEWDFEKEGSVEKLEKA